MRMLGRHTIAAAALLLVLAPPGRGHEAQAAEAKPATPAPAPLPAGAPRRGPLVEPILRPGSAKPDPGDAKAGTLRREGEFLADQRVHLRRAPNSANFLAAFEPDPKGTPPPMAVLPGQILHNMELRVEERGDRTLFLVSGQVTTYRGANYFLPTSSVVWTPPRIAMPATAPATAPAPRRDGKSVSAEQVLHEMGSMIERNAAIEAPPRVAATPPQTKVMDPAVLGPAPGERPVSLRHEGEFVVERRGRLVQASGSTQSLFAFDSDSPNSPEPPMILLPCQLLQSMENLAQERGDRVVFILTGQVFTYRGANHLLPTTMKLAIDKGNLRK